MKYSKKVNAVGKFAIIAVLILTLTCLSGCGSSKATDALESTFLAIQNQDEQEINKYLSAVMFEPELYSVSNVAFAAVYFSDFSYEIIDAETNKDGTVTVNVKVTTKSISEMLKALEEALSAALDSESYSVTGNSADEHLISIFESRDWVTHENNFGIVMQKDGSGNWQPEDKALFGAMLLDGYDPRQVLAG